MRVEEGIKLSHLYHIKKIVRFRNEYAPFLQQIVYSHDDLAPVLHMSEHACRDDDRGLAEYVLHFFCALHVKTRSDSPNAIGICDFGDIGRVNSQDSLTLFFKTRE